MTKQNILSLIIVLLLCFGTAGLGSFFTSQSVSTWYPTLQKPPWTPPSWLFAPVWTLLYILMGISGWLLWKERSEPLVQLLLLLFVVQLILNAGWSGIFFGMRQPGWAIADILLLWVAIGWYILQGREISVAASLLFVPYWIWVTFAAALNISVWWLNRSV